MMNAGRAGFLGLAVVLAAGGLMAGGRARNVGSVRGGAHDLSQRFPSAAQDDACAFCHTSHEAGAEGALWNVALTSRSYSTYESPVSTWRAGQPDGSTKLCLSCHDGLVAPTVRRVKRGDGAAEPLQLAAPRQRIDNDLSNDHPVSIPYESGAALMRRSLLPANSTPSGLGGTLREDLLDAQGKLQCTSCHEPHGTANRAFLVVPADDDQLCRACHHLRDFDVSAHGNRVSATTDLGCAACHRPHDAWPGTPLLTAREPDLCLPCHQVQGTRWTTSSSRHGGRAIPGMRQGVAITCSTCHDPHVVEQGLTSERRILTDPRDAATIPRLLDSASVPYNALERPREALENRPEFCLTCHSGGWPGAANILSELRNPAVRASEFALGRVNLHQRHTSAFEGQGIGCTYCHDVHGSPGTVGIRRDALLYPWLNVRTFPYRDKRSCGAGDPLGRCH
jgi:predicted CXXCH cytochrome family protein